MAWPHLQRLTDDELLKLLRTCRYEMQRAIDIDDERYLRDYANDFQRCCVVAKERGREELIEQSKQYPGAT